MNDQDVDKLLRENAILKERDKVRKETILAQLELIEAHQRTIVALEKAINALTASAVKHD